MTAILLIAAIHLDSIASARTSQPVPRQFSLFLFFLLAAFLLFTLVDSRRFLAAILVWHLPTFLFYGAWWFNLVCYLLFVPALHFLESWAYSRGKSLLVPILIHAAYNAFATATGVSRFLYSGRMPYEMSMPDMAIKMGSNPLFTVSCFRSPSCSRGNCRIAVGNRTSFPVDEVGMCRGSNTGIHPAVMLQNTSLPPGSGGGRRRPSARTPPFAMETRQGRGPFVQPREEAGMGMAELLGSMLQTGMSRSSNTRMRGVLGGAGGLASTGVPIGGALGNLLNEAGRAVGGKQNLAIGGLGALAGAVMGGGRGLGGAIRGGIGGGAVAMLGLMAYNALKGSGGSRAPAVPLGLAVPKTEGEKAELERHAKLILKAMIDAAKADGGIDASEMSRILAKVQETGSAAGDLEFLKAEMGRPMDTEGLVAEAGGSRELAAELYAASLLAIEVDTSAERDYLARLADFLDLGSDVVQRLHEAVALER